jgi:ATP-dependent helicase Lhr and Lhr-like helicase
MSDLTARLALKARLPRTWPAFFERHGDFSPTQLAAIPALLDGRNILLCAPTASGKTEAALAPLIERHCPPTRPSRGPRILYLTPTRALVNDLAARLARPLESLGLTLGVKTRDLNTFRAARPPDVLITTPESADSTLAARAKTFIGLQAIVLDELHLSDGTPRGDQLRVILNRMRRVRAYAFERGDAVDAAIQYAALSATVDAPEATAARYFEGALAIQIAGGRAIEAEQLPLAPDRADELLAYLATFRGRGWRKALAFCNSRAEVEAYATAVRERSPFGAAVYVHYSNIEARRRREIEQQFAQAGAAICFASSTLELGIDIGDIDIVILIGPPGSRSSLVQRIGRGNRRRGTTRVACFYRTPLERLLFDALLADQRPTTDDQRRPTSDEGQGDKETRRQGEGEAVTQNSKLKTQNSERPFRPAVAVQQIFSLIKQSPIAAVRLAELTGLFADMLSPADLQAILGALQLRGYLQAGRPGEWRAGDRLNDLFDQQTGAQPGLSVYSNIQGGDMRQIEVRDQHTQQTVARVDALWLNRDVLTLEGRPFNIEWCDGEALWIAAYQGQGLADRPIFRSARQLLSFDLAQLLPARLGLARGTAPFVNAPEGWYWFHWLGDLYGQAALDLSRYRIAAEASIQPGLCLRQADEPQAPPAWTEEQVARYLGDNYRRFESLLPLGPFQHLLPVHLRRRAVVEQFDVVGFLAAAAALRPLAAPEELAEDLTALLADSQRSSAPDAGP